MIEDVDSKARHEPRTNLFVMGTISASTASGPVKVRNLSPTGALVEGASLPPAKEEVRLRRGSLAVTGEVVWCRSGQAGLRFFSRVKVKEWLPTSGNRVAQQRLDELLQQCRVESGPTSPPQLAAAAMAGPTKPSELEEIARALAALADDLSDDPTVVARHSSGLQMLDVAAQVLRRLAGVIP